MRAELKKEHGDFIATVVQSIQADCEEFPDPIQAILGYHFRKLDKTKGFRIALLKALHDLRVSSGCTPIPEPELVKRAKYLHLIHEVSLIIDDIFDRDLTRRGQRSVHCRFGTVRAASASGWLSVWAMQHFADNPALIRAILDCAKQIATAEILQWEARLYPRPIDMEVWKDIAHGDTGALFRLTARFAGCRPEQYQIPLLALTYLYHGLDDVQDMQDDRAEDGLSGGLHADVRDRIPTLLTCFTPETDEESLRAVVPLARDWLRSVALIQRPPELEVFFSVLVQDL